MTPNDGVYFTTDSEEAGVHATNGMKMTRSGKPVICHTCGKYHYANRCLDREESAPENKAYKVEDTPKKESAPTKASVNVAIGEDWGDNTNYSGLMFYQVKAEAATNKEPNMEYQHALSQSGGHTIPTWFLLDNQYTVDVFSNRRLLKNIRKSGRELEILSTGGQKNYKPPGGSPRIYNIVIPPGRHIKHTIPIKSGRKIPLVLQQHLREQVSCLPTHSRSQVIQEMREGTILLRHGFRTGDGASKYCRSQ